ncbi:MAG: hypothetical protein Athens101410_479 [Parcubacteria group bacterium Athens1014_10]|nr:MAG: hypothetical protein Athens101410_479 [Parcubacteria group bacterium Athens1014_10]
MMKNKTIFWDYNLNNLDLKNPHVKTWLLNRKLKFGDLSDISKKDLKKFLSVLKIENSIKELLQNYLKSNARC